MKTTPAGGDEVEKNPGVGSGWGWRADGYYTVQPTAWRGVPSTRTQTHEHETTGTSYLAWPANKSGPLRWAGLGFWPSQGPSAVGNPEWEGGDGRRRRAGWRNLRICTVLVGLLRTSYSLRVYEYFIHELLHRRTDGEQRPGNKNRPRVGTARHGWRSGG